MQFYQNSKVLFFLLLFIVCASTSTFCQMPELLAPGASAPSSTLEGTDGNKHTFPASEAYSIIFYWSLFCHSCLDEIPGILSHLEKNDVKAETFFITLDTKRMEKGVKNFLKKRKIKHPVLYEEIASDSYVTADKWGVVMTPSVFITDPEGKVIYSNAGPMDIDKFFSDFAEMQNKRNESQKDCN
jgi:peroxiredoxin